jgi:uncharacterized membrane protein YkoI
MKTTAIRCALLAAATACIALPALADSDDLPKMRAIAAGAKLISLEDAQAKALAAKPGTIVDVDLERRFMGKNYDYEFEIIDAEGKEWEVNINARDGSVRSIRQDWFD